MFWGRRCLLTAVFVAGMNSSHHLFAQAEVDRGSVIPVNQLATGGQPVTAALVKAADSSRRTRSEAVDQLPVAHLSPDGQAKVQQVLKDLSLFRRLPTLEIEADRRTYEFFTAHPDAAVSVWRALQISSVQMKEVNSNFYRTDTNDGTVGTVEVLLRSPGSYLVLCQGLLQSPGMPRPIQAKALMHLQPKFDTRGRVTHHLDLFVSFPSQTIETIAKLTSPVSFRIADRNFEEVSLFVALMSSAMSRQPGWVEQTSQRMDGLAPGRTNDLLKVTAAVYVDAERRRLAAAGLPVTPESILPPVSTQAAAPGERVVR